MLTSIHTHTNDILIIGAGMAGLLAALARAILSVAM